MVLVLSNRPFRAFSLSNFLSLTGIWIVRVSVGWLTWELTRSKTWLGVMAFAELGPSVLISLYGGALADKFDRFSILSRGQTTQVILAAMLAILSLTGTGDIWLILAILLGFSVVGGINLPARMSMAPALVDPIHLATASAIGSVTLNVTRLIGPLLAAPLIAMSLEGIAFAIAACFFAASALLLRAVRPKGGGEAGAGPVPAGEPARAAARPAGYGEIWRALAGDSALLSVMAAQFVMWLTIRPLTDMLPAYADQMFRAGEFGFSALTAMVGVGALAGAFAVMGEGAGEGARRWMIGGMVTAAVAMACLGLVPTIWLALPIILVYGAAVTATSVTATTFVQLRTPNQRLGRMMSLFSFIYRFAPAVGAVLLGAAADRMGLAAASVLFPAVLLLVLALAWRRLNDGHAG